MHERGGPRAAGPSSPTARVGPPSRAVDDLAVLRYGVDLVGEDGVAAGAAVDAILRAVAGVDRVVARPAEDRVRARAAGEAVVPRAAADRVPAGAAVEDVVARR